MSTPTMESILQKTRELVQTKQAEYKNTLAKEAQVTESQPQGADGKDDSEITRGHALEVDQPALEPEKQPAESADAGAEPNSGGKGTEELATGADGKDDSEITRGHATDATQPPTTPKQVPAESDEAMNVDTPDKTAGVAKLANEILADIRGYQSQSAAPAPEKAAEYACPECKADKMEDCKCEKKKKAAPAADAPKEAAEGPAMELTTDVLAKIAAVVLSSEEGTNFVTDQLAKAAGAEEAVEMLDFVAQQSELAEKEAAYKQGEADAEAMYQQALYEAGLLEGQKAAELQKLGQDIADSSIEDLMAAGGEGDMGGEAAPMGEEMGAEADPMGGMMGDEMGAEGGEDISPEELAAALEELAASGEIAPEEAQEVLQYISGDEGAPMEEAAPVEPPAEAPAEAPAEEAPVEDTEEPAEEKQSAANTAKDLLAAIRQVKAARS